MKTKMITKAGLLSLSLVLTLFIHSASAVPTQFLPESSYAAGAWQGSAFYERVWNDGWLRGRIDYAVYDTASMQPGSGEKTLTDNLALPGRFVYAYQVFNDYERSDKAVAYFELLTGGQLPLDLYEESIGSYDDGSEGRASTSEYLSENKLKVVWEFTGGLLYKGDHSWFLVLSSEAAPVLGSYEVIGSEETEGPMPDEVPEPATIALLGLGGAVLALLKRRKSVH